MVSSQRPPGLVICGIVRRKRTALKLGTLPTYRNGSRSSPNVFPPPAAPPYMTMSAELLRNWVCGPGWAEILVVHRVNILILRAPKRSGSYRQEPGTEVVRLRWHAFRLASVAIISAARRTTQLEHWIVLYQSYPRYKSNS